MCVIRARKTRVTFITDAPGNLADRELPVAQQHLCLLHPHHVRICMRGRPEHFAKAAGQFVPVQADPNCQLLNGGRIMQFSLVDSCRGFDRFRLRFTSPNTKWAAQREHIYLRHDITDNFDRLCTNVDTFKWLTVSARDDLICIFQYSRRCRQTESLGGADLTQKYWSVAFGNMCGIQTEMIQKVCPIADDHDPTQSGSDFSVRYRKWEVGNLQRGRADCIDAISRPASIRSADRDLNANKVPTGHGQTVWLARHEIQYVKENGVVDPTITMLRRDKDLIRRAKRLTAMHEILATKFVLNDP